MSARGFSIRFILLAVVVTIGLPQTELALGGSSSPQVSTTIVISEFRTRGPNGGNDEFIELYNKSSGSIDIGDWEIWGSNSGGTTSHRATIPTGTTLGSGCRYLLTDSHTTGGPYSGSTTGDQTYSSGITNVTIAQPGSRCFLSSEN
jgi:hypothetical protein